MNFNSMNVWCWKLQMSLLRVWSRLYLEARSAKMGISSQSPSSEFNDLRMGKDSWQVFTGQEVSLGLLYIRYLWELHLSLHKFHYSKRCLYETLHFVSSGFISDWNPFTNYQAFLKKCKIGNHMTCLPSPCLTLNFPSLKISWLLSMSDAALWATEQDNYLLIS